MSHPRVGSALSSLLRRTTSTLKQSSTARPLNRFFTTTPPTSTSTPTNTNTTTTTKMAATPFLELVKARRSYYPLGRDLPISTERIQEIVKEATLHVPSSFNAQPVRVVVLFGAEHEKLWDLTTEALKAIVPEDKFQPTADKMAMFKASAGSVLFFEDKTTVEGQQAAFPIYADKFAHWAVQADAMLQHTVWVALEAEGLGANLQHYNPLIDEKVAATWELPSSWQLSAQLVFGSRTGEAGPKTFLPIEERVKVFGA
ncbi:Nitroreductase-like protein [Xylariales sp. PMI_506]|nr:Nitroreductase-like protein [Xylariales sp. PMI_506]